MTLPKLRSLQARIALFFVILLITVQAVLVLLVSVSGERIAKDRIAQDLLLGERVFRRLIEQSNRQLTDAARILAADFGFRTAIATRDYGTIVSALANHGARIDANVVMLADLKGLSYKEIADEVGCPLGTVMSRLFRGRRLLRRSLKDYAIEMGIVRSESALPSQFEPDLAPAMAM